MIDYPAILRLLRGAGAEIIIVGGAAGIAHGASRLTQDLDLVYRRDEENYGRLVSALVDRKPYPRGAPAGLPFRWDVETIRNGLNFTLSTSLGALDLLGEITGGGNYDDLLPNSISLNFSDFDCLCISLEHLIRVKRALGRPKDLEAIAELESILEEIEK